MAGFLIGRGTADVYMLPKFGNRHGLVAGATGTGKTVSLQVLAEGFSAVGTPVFLADVKGDLAGLSQPGNRSERLQARLEKMALTDYSPSAFPVLFWDIFGRDGHPLRTTVSEIGPLLLARMLELNDTQEGVLQVLFRVADDEGLLLLDLKDFRAMLQYLSEHAKEVSAQYGLVSTQSIAAIQRALLKLEADGARDFFGEPALDLGDFFQLDPSGRGLINIMVADQLILRPRLYSSFLLWLLSELFEQLPEVGDLAQPKMVFFFDEAHLLFDDAPPALVQRIEQVVRLIRSKGIGVYFISQNPDDVPGDVLGQLANRLQHALRAYTPRDQKAVRTAAETFPVNPNIDVAQAISTLGVGEALISTLQDGGIPMPVQQCLVMPPRSRIGVINANERAAVQAASPLAGKYEASIDRESAFERLSARQAEQQNVSVAPPPLPSSGSWGRIGGIFAPAEPSAPAPRASRTPRAAPAPRASQRQGVAETLAKSVARSVGSNLGRQIIRGLLGAILKR